jgi:hypothetical protein
MVAAMTYYHGGLPGLRAGDILTPGNDRKHHDNCPWCAARAQGETHQGIDPPSEHHSIYVTTHRLYAKHYASLWGHGDLYRIEPIGDVTASSEDTIPTWRCDQARILAVLDKAVELSYSERRRLGREWTAADIAKHPDRAAAIRIEAAKLDRQLDRTRRLLPKR